MSDGRVRVSTLLRISVHSTGDLYLLTSISSTLITPYFSFPPEPETDIIMKYRVIFNDPPHKPNDLPQRLVIIPVILFM